MTGTIAWNYLANLPMEEVVAWVIVVAAIVGGIIAGGKRLYKLFEAYKNMTQANKDLKDKVNQHDDTLKDIYQSLRSIQTSLQEQKDVNMRQLRSSIVQICEMAIKAKNITLTQNKMLQELFDEYKTVFNGDGWIEALVQRVRKLPVSGNQSL